jgi:NADPH:quinone reductase
VLVVGDQPTPVPGAGEVRVRVRTSGANPSDAKRRAGRSGRPETFPLVIPHSDGAGQIDAVGPGVPQARIGERVWLWNAAWRRPHGTAAEFVAVPTEQAVRCPDDLDYGSAACLGIPALTALHAVRLAGRARTILIAGGAGAVGHYAIQIAKTRSTQVFTTVSSEAKAQHAKDAGADAVINYCVENVVDHVLKLTDHAGVDAVIEVDLAANAPLLEGVLRPHGIAVVYGASRAEAALPVRRLLQRSATLRFFLVYDLQQSERTEALETLAELLAAHRLIHTVAARFPLDRIVEAHEAVEAGGMIGNVVVDV